MIWETIRRHIPNPPIIFLLTGTCNDPVGFTALHHPWVDYLYTYDIFNLRIPWKENLNWLVFNISTPVFPIWVSVSGRSLLSLFPFPNSVCWFLLSPPNGSRISSNIKIPWQNCETKLNNITESFKTQNCQTGATSDYYNDGDNDDKYEE